MWADERYIYTINHVVDGREEIGWISHDQSERWIFSPNTTRENIHFMGVDGLWHVDYLRGSYPPPPGLSEIPVITDKDGNEFNFSHPGCIFYPINTELKNVCCITVPPTTGPSDVTFVFDMTNPPRFEPYNSEETVNVYSWDQ